jgi:hypothetical protein
MRYLYIATIAAILLAATSGAAGASGAQTKPGTIAPAAASTPSKARRAQWTSAGARRRAAAPLAEARERCNSILCPRYMVLGVGY